MNEVESQPAIDAHLVPPHGRSLGRRLGAALVWVTAGRLVATALTLLTTALAARVFDIASFGRYVLLLTMTIVVGVGLQLGMQQTLVRELARPRRSGPDAVHAKDLVLAARHLCAAASLVWIALLLGLANSAFVRSAFGTTERNFWLFALAGLTIGRAFEQLIGEAFRGAGNHKAASLLGGNVTSCLTLLVLLAELGLRETSQNNATVLISLGMAGLVAAGAAELSYRRSELSSEEHGIAAKAYGRLLADSWPVWIAGVLAMIFLQVDVWIVARLGTPSETAIYGAAARLVILVSSPLLLVNGALSPFISELYATNRKELLQKLLHVSATVASLPAVLILGTFVAFPEKVLSLIYGPRFVVAAPILVILSIGHFLNVWAGSNGFTLLMIGHQRAQMMLSVSIGLLQVAVLLVFTRALGLVGIAAVTAAGLALSNIAMWAAAKRLGGVWTHASPLRALRAIREFSPEMLAKLRRQKSA